MNGPLIARKSSRLVLALLVTALVHSSQVADALDHAAHDWSSQSPLTYSNVYGYIRCPVSQQLSPRNTAELAAAIKDLYSRAAAGQQVKIRATHRGFGSSASFPCPVQPKPASSSNSGSSGSGGSKTHTRGSSSSSQQPIIVGVIMGQMTHVLAVNHTDETMKVQASMMLGDLYRHAAIADMSVPLGLMPAWSGLTLAGVMSASAHGSGANTTSSVCDMVKEITWVDGRGNIHTSGRHSEAGHGLCSGLGLLGIVTELTLQLQPITHTEINTWHLQDDANLFSDIEEMLQESPRLLILWRPDVHKYSGYLLKEVPATQPADEDAVCTILPSVIPPVAVFSGAILKEWQEDINNSKQPLATAFDAFACTAALTMSVGQPWSASNGKPIFSGTVLTNKAQSVDCGGDCAWTSSFANTTIQDQEFTISRKDVPNWIQDVNKIIRQDLQPGLLDATHCLPPGFFVLRFGRPSADLLSTAGDIAEPVYVQHITMRAKQAKPVPSKYEWVQEAFEQLTLCKYNGRPHWGKCFDRTFTNPACPVRQKYGSRFDTMLQLQSKYDPLKMYEPELFRKLLDAASQQKGPNGLTTGCVMDRTCYCVKDEHCAPGFRCVGSSAFPEFRVCKPPAFST